MNLSGCSHALLILPAASALEAPLDHKIRTGDGQCLATSAIEVLVTNLN
jgi:hypothetical protein